MYESIKVRNTQEIKQRKTLNGHQNDLTTMITCYLKAPFLANKTPRITYLFQPHPHFTIKPMSCSSHDSYQEPTVHPQCPFISRYTPTMSVIRQIQHAHYSLLIIKHSPDGWQACTQLLARDSESQYHWQAKLLTRRLIGGSLDTSVI